MKKEKSVWSSARSQYLKVRHAYMLAAGCTKDEAEEILIPVFLKALEAELKK
jgi:hypothetical protein